jgi:methylmalonyl-CoA/ethylmalonyl-CoA epimerase
MNAEASFGLTGIVKRFDHVSWAVRDIRSALPLVELLGGRFYQGADHPRNKFRWVQFHLPQGLLEIMSPLGEESFLHRFIEQRGEGLHHLTFQVEDLAEAVEKAEEKGFTVTGLHFNEHWSEAFLHPRTTNGVLIQLAQWKEDIWAGYTLEEVMAGLSIDPT